VACGQLLALQTAGQRQQSVISTVSTSASSTPRVATAENSASGVDAIDVYGIGRLNHLAVLLAPDLHREPKDKPKRDETRERDRLLCPPPPGALVSLIPSIAPSVLDSAPPR
jgi:hypothetical protein